MFLLGLKRSSGRPFSTRMSRWSLSWFVRNSQGTLIPPLTAAVSPHVVRQELRHNNCCFPQHGNMYSRLRCVTVTQRRLLNNKRFSYFLGNDRSPTDTWSAHAWLTTIRERSTGWTSTAATAQRTRRPTGNSCRSFSGGGGSRSPRIAWIACVR